MADVWFVPGFIGSELGSGPGGADLTWLDYTRLALGGARRLALAADGVSPLPPDGQQQYTGGLVSPYYGAAAGQLRQQLAGVGLTMEVYAYDWRLLTRSQGSSLAARIRSSTSMGHPCSIAAHSHGGLVARAAWASLVASGDTGLVRRIVTMGTPHWGTWRVGQVWSGGDTAMQQMALLSLGRVAGLGAASVLIWGPPYTAAELVRIMQTLPALYEVSPALVGPEVSGDPLRSTFYTSSAWPGDKRPSQGWLDYARSDWQPWLTSAASNPPSWVLTTVAGTGIPTGAYLVAREQLGTIQGIGLSQAGDGTVTVGSALLPGSAQFTVHAAHADLPLHLALSGDLLRMIREVRVGPAPPPPPVISAGPLVTILSGPPLPGPQPFTDPP